MCSISMYIDRLHVCHMYVNYLNVYMLNVYMRGKQSRGLQRVQSHRMPCLYRSFSAKEPYN